MPWGRRRAWRDAARRRSETTRVTTRKCRRKAISLSRQKRLYRPYSVAGRGARGATALVNEEKLTRLEISISDREEACLIRNESKHVSGGGAMARL